jgi:hypothetical protein
MPFHIIKNEYTGKYYIENTNTEMIYNKEKNLWEQLPEPETPDTNQTDQEPQEPQETPITETTTKPKRNKKYDHTSTRHKTTPD